MPIYPYRCDFCQSYQEEYIKLEHYSETPKPQCCGEQMCRVFTPPMVISDDLGVHGVVNPADGKSYSSKSEYYKSVKAAGCHVVGDEAGKKKKRAYEGDHDIKKELQEAVQQHLGA